MAEKWMKKRIRKIKDTQYTEEEVRVRKATSSDPWGASNTEMSQIAADTFDANKYRRLFEMLWRRLNDHEHRKHVQKSLFLVEYLLRNGHVRFVRDVRARSRAISRLQRYKYIKDAQDLGEEVRNKSTSVMNLLMDDERLKAERDKAETLRGKIVARSSANQNPSRVYHSTTRDGFGRGGGQEDEDFGPTYTSKDIEHPTIEKDTHTPGGYDSRSETESTESDETYEEEELEASSSEASEESPKPRRKKPAKKTKKPKSPKPRPKKSKDKPKRRTKSPKAKKTQNRKPREESYEYSEEEEEFEGGQAQWGEDPFSVENEFDENDIFPEESPFPDESPDFVVDSPSPKERRRKERRPKERRPKEKAIIAFDADPPEFGELVPSPRQSAPASEEENVDYGYDQDPIVSTSQITPDPEPDLLTGLGSTENTSGDWTNQFRDKKAEHLAFEAISPGFDPNSVDLSDDFSDRTESDYEDPPEIRHAVEQKHQKEQVFFDQDFINLEDITKTKVHDVPKKKARQRGGGMENQRAKTIAEMEGEKRRQLDQDGFDPMAVGQNLDNLTLGPNATNQKPKKKTKKIDIYGFEIPDDSPQQPIDQSLPLTWNEPAVNAPAASHSPQNKSYPRGFGPQSSWRCPQCNLENAMAQSRCAQCGKPQPQMYFGQQQYAAPAHLDADPNDSFWN